MHIKNKIDRTDRTKVYKTDYIVSGIQNRNDKTEFNRMLHTI